MREDILFRFREKWVSPISAMRDKEAGRVLKIMMGYAQGGSKPPSAKAREFLEEVFKDLDGQKEHAASVSRAYTANGKKGGRPPLKRKLAVVKDEETGGREE